MIDSLRERLSRALHRLANAVDSCPLHTLGNGPTCRRCEQHEKFWDSLGA